MSFNARWLFDEIEHISEIQPLDEVVGFIHPQTWIELQGFTEGAMIDGSILYLEPGLTSIEVRKNPLVKRNTIIFIPRELVEEYVS